MKKIFFYISLILSFIAADANAQKFNRKAPGLIDYVFLDLDFNRIVDGVVRDNIGGHDLTITGEVPLVRSRHGWGANCDRQGAKLNYFSSNDPAFDWWALGQDFTLEYWVYIDEIDASSQAVLGKRGQGIAQHSLIVYNGDAGEINHAFWETLLGAATFVNGNDVTNTLVVGWNHILVWYNNSTGVISIAINNGTPTTGAATVASTETTQAIPFTVCVLAGSHLPFGGVVEHIRGYSDDIGAVADNRTKLYNNGEGPVPLWSLTHGPTTVESAPPPPPPVEAPDAPTLAVTDVGLNSISLTITPAGTGGEVVSFTTKWGTVMGGPYPNEIPPTTNLTQEITNLAEGTTYYFVTTATNSAGSATSTEVSGTTDATPPAGTDTYATLNALTCNSGDTFTLVSADGKINGTFLCVEGDPLGLGAFGGIVVASATGGNWWFRQFQYGPNTPIEMDWAELADDADVTTYLTNIATKYTPFFYVRTPSVARTFKISAIDFYALGIRKYYLLHTDNVEIVWDVLTPQAIVMKGTGIDAFVVGSTEIEGPFFEFVGAQWLSTWNWNTGGCPNYKNTNGIGWRGFGVAMIDVATNGYIATTSDFAINADYKDSREAGLRYIGGNSPMNVMVKGWFNNALLYGTTTAGITTLDVDVDDRRGCQQDAYTDNPAGGGSKTSNLQFHEHIKGRIGLHYGDSHSFFAAVKKAGTAADPLDMECKERGYDVNGVNITGGPAYCWKVDPIALGQKNSQGSNPIPERTWWVKTTFGPSVFGNDNQSWQLEATNEGNGEFFTEKVSAVSVNGSGYIYLQVVQNYNQGSPTNCDAGECAIMRFNSLTGNGVDPITTGDGPVVLAYSDTLHDGTAARVQIGRRSNANTLLAKGNVIRNMTFTSTITTPIKFLGVGGAPTGLGCDVDDNLFENIIIEGAARLIFDSTCSETITGNVIETIKAAENATIKSPQNWTCGVTPVTGSGTPRTIQSLPGAVNNGDGTWTACQP